MGKRDGGPLGKRTVSDSRSPEIAMQPADLNRLFIGFVEEPVPNGDHFIYLVNNTDVSYQRVVIVTGMYTSSTTTSWNRVRRTANRGSSGRVPPYYWRRGQPLEKAAFMSPCAAARGWRSWQCGMDR